MTPQSSVTVVATILNEEAAIARLLDSLLEQTRPPDEVVIADGGSLDGTLAVLASYQERLPLRVLRCPGANISRGRNAAIAAAQGEIILCTDAGVRLSPTWVEHLAGAFERYPGATWPQVAAGFFLADPRSPFELALGATVLPHADEIDPWVFLPSSRSVAFTKEAWQRVGGYPEWLDYCEDVVFDRRLREAYGVFAWVPQAIAHFPPRSSLGAFMLQYYRYARGDGKANLWPQRHLLRYLAYLGGGLLLLLGSRWPLAWVALVGGSCAYLYRPVRRLGRMSHHLPWSHRLLALGDLPLIRLGGDLAKMVGYPVGLWWRWRRRDLGG